MTNDQLDEKLPVRRSPWGTWGTIAVGAVLTVVWVLYLKPHIQLQDALNQPGVGKHLPLLELQPLTGTTDGLSLEAVRGKVTLINYWGTWCGYCMDEFPHMLELWDKYRGNPEFAFVSVAVSEGGPAHEDIPKLQADVEKFLKSRGATYPTYVDPDAASRKFLANVIDMEGFGYPTSVLLDRNGVIRALWLGYQPGYDQQIEQMVSQLLTEKVDLKKSIEKNAATPVGSTE
ncbi:MAG TPA: TlpA disulfide reductase family protein [Pirellulales bacterium]|nr:TlpA disulfide reductase family protein [Pirellulales bacterium]